MGAKREWEMRAHKTLLTRGTRKTHPKKLKSRENNINLDVGGKKREIEEETGRAGAPGSRVKEKENNLHRKKRHPKEK